MKRNRSGQQHHSRWGSRSDHYSSAKFCARSRKPHRGGQEDQQKTEVFVGKVIKARDGRYALLTDEQAGKGVYLDDQEKAKPFEGKNVKVTGALEVAKNLVHVTDIQLA